MKYYFLLFFLSTFCLSFSQEKFEKEYHLKLEEVPQLAKDFVVKFNFNKRVKWYKEESDRGNSIEAKTKYKGSRYSIEFETNGTLEDVEIKVGFESLPKEVQQFISKTFSTSFQKWKIDKVQLQYSGEPSAVFLFISEKASKQDIIINYEIVVKGKNDNRYYPYEFLFSEEGKTISKQKINYRNTDNIEY
jgi:cation transport regulator ChaB